MTNRNTTLESLMAVLNLLSAKTKEEFCIEYLKATHDKRGADVWYLIHKSKKVKK